MLFHVKYTCYLLALTHVHVYMCATSMLLLLLSLLLPYCLIVFSEYLYHEYTGTMILLI